MNDAPSSTNFATVEPVNKEHIGDNIISADLFIIEMFSSLECSKYCRNYTGIVGHAFVQRFITLRPCLGESPTEDSTVFW